MITRRDFIAATAATISNPLSSNAAGAHRIRSPLKAVPRVRTLFSKPAINGRLLLLTDGPQEPPKLIRPKALERMFGAGTSNMLQQPDHWRMIEEGWFSGDDLFEPAVEKDHAFYTWHANYRPETEAHDLLYDIFRDQIDSPFGLRLPSLGLELAEHPSTPRYATAKLDGEWCLPNLMAAVCERTKWIKIGCSQTTGEIEL